MRGGESTDIKSIIGPIIGAIYGGFGYAVAKGNNPDEKFNAKKFAKTVAVGFILGLAADSMGVDIAQVEGMSAVGFWTVIVDKLAGLLIKEQKA